MSAPDFFVSEITADELAAGFRVEDIKNPDAHRAGQPPRMKSVVYRWGFLGTGSSSS